MNHEELQDLLAPYALGSLPAPERAAVDKHLAAGCPDCPGMLSRFEAAAPLLAQALKPLAPPPRIKTLLMERIQRNRFVRQKYFAMAASVLLLVGVTGLWMRHTAEASWEVMSVQGAVEMDGAPVQAGAVLRPGQKLTTGEGGLADVRLGSRAVFRLAPASQAVALKEDGGLRVRLERGGLLSLVKTGNRYAVQTPVATASVLGTVFYTQMEGPDRTYLCLCRGRLHIDAGTASQDVQTRDHQAAYLTRAGQQTSASPAPMLNHFEKDLILPDDFKDD